MPRASERRSRLQALESLKRTRGQQYLFGRERRGRLGDFAPSELRPVVLAGQAIAGRNEFPVGSTQNLRHRREPHLLKKVVQGPTEGAFPTVNFTIYLYMNGLHPKLPPRVVWREYTHLLGKPNLPGTMYERRDEKWPKAGSFDAQRVPACRASAQRSWQHSQQPPPPTPV